MGKSTHNISNWKQYNQALVQGGSLTLWMDDQAIKQWHCQTHHGRRGRGLHYSDTAIETALMAQGCIQAGRGEVLAGQFRRSYPRTHATPRLYEGMTKPETNKHCGEGYGQSGIRNIYMVGFLSWN